MIPLGLKHASSVGIYTSMTEATAANNHCHPDSLIGSFAGPDIILSISSAVLSEKLTNVSKAFRPHYCSRPRAQRRGDDNKLHRLVTLIAGNGEI